MRIIILIYYGLWDSEFVKNLNIVDIDLFRTI